MTFDEEQTRDTGTRWTLKPGAVGRVRRVPHSPSPPPEVGAPRQPLLEGDSPATVGDGGAPTSAATGVWSGVFFERTFALSIPPVPRYRSRQQPVRRLKAYSREALTTMDPGGTAQHDAAEDATQLPGQTDIFALSPESDSRYGFQPTRTCSPLSVVNNY